MWYSNCQDALPEIMEAIQKDALDKYNSGYVKVHRSLFHREEYVVVELHLEYYDRNFSGESISTPHQEIHVDYFTFVEIKLLYNDWATLAPALKDACNRAGYRFFYGDPKQKEERRKKNNYLIVTVPVDILKKQ